jgi:hypothetical protein
MFSYYNNHNVLVADKDECELGLAIYPENSKCVNTEGGYTFKCCAGYRKVGDYCEGTHKAPSNTMHW